MTQQVEVAIIGAGQAGLAAGYYLSQQNRNFVILEKAEQVGQAWRDRWDSLKLITPNPYNDLPGLSFPSQSIDFPTRNDVISYLENYAHKYQFPIEYSQSVNVLKSIDNGFRIEANTRTIEAQHVIVATGAFHKPFIPRFSSDLPDNINQIHSSQYRNPKQLAEGAVLIVGSGNSGVQIAKEISIHHKVYLSVGNSPTLPRQIWGRDLYWWLNTLKVTRINVSSRLGKRFSKRPDSVVGINLQKLARENNIILLGHTQSASENHLLFSGGETIPISEIKTIIWASGFRSDYSWIEIPVFNSNYQPFHRRGVTPIKGLYFLGLRWQYRITSSLIGGIGEDAAYIANKIAASSIENIKINPVSKYLLKS
jgi:putative flavoprotein involved in K+ transport